MGTWGRGYGHMDDVWARGGCMCMCRVYGHVESVWARGGCMGTW